MRLRHKLFFKIMKKRVFGRILVLMAPIAWVFFFRDLGKLREKMGKRGPPAFAGALIKFFIDKFQKVRVKTRHK